MIGRTKDWLRTLVAFHGTAVGLVLGSAAVVAFGGVTLLIYMPIGPSRATEGRVLRFASRESDTGSYPVAWVKVAESVAVVPLSRSQRCAVGDKVELREYPLLGGRRRFSAGWQGCIPPTAD